MINCKFAKVNFNEDEEIIYLISFNGICIFR